MTCQTQSLQDAGQGGIQIEKGADKAQGGDKITCKRTVKERGAGPSSQKDKCAHAAQAHETAIFDSLKRSAAHGIHISQSVILRDDGQQEYRYGAGQGIGKEDKGHGHAGEDPVYTQGGDIVISVRFKLGRYGDGLNALQKVQYDTVCRQRQSHGKQLAKEHSGRSRPGGGNCGVLSFFSLGPDGGNGHQHGEEFAHSQSQHGNADGEGLSLREEIARYYVYAAYPGNLLQKLSEGGNACFFDAVEISVDAGMHRG